MKTFKVCITEGPHIRLRRENPVSETLHSQPLDRERAVGLLVVIVGLVDVLGQSEVADLDHVVLGQEDVTARQVSVHHLFAGQILHSPSNLDNKKCKLGQNIQFASS